MGYSSIRRVAVLGAGVMGSGIAAHVAGAGVEVLLLDLSHELVMAALEKLKKAKPPLLFHPRDIERIQTGTFATHLAEAAHCDWVVEAVREDAATKQELFGKLEPLLGEKTIVTSNTSGIRLKQLLEGRSASFCQRFLISHFFNPVRYMHLLELIAGEQTDPAVLQTMAFFGEQVLGKGVVYGHDTPNFVGNRIGLYAIMGVLHRVFRGEYTIDEADAVLGPVIGRAKSAVFRTADLVGLDTLLSVAHHSYEQLPYDEERKVFQPPEKWVAMVKQGLLGEKSGRGFYQKKPDGLFCWDVQTGDYRKQEKPNISWEAAFKRKPLAERLRSVVMQADRLGELAKRSTLEVLAYASRRIGPRTEVDGNQQDPPICEDLVQIDRAIRWGFNWEMGPFEMWDALGVEATVAQMDALGIRPAAWVREMIQRGESHFYHENMGTGTVIDASHVPQQKTMLTKPSLVSLDPLRLSQKPVLQNDGAALWDIGDGIACLEFRSKMNTIDGDVIAFLKQAVEEGERNFLGLVVGNEAKEAFSAGANLLMILMLANQGNWTLLEQVIRDFQRAAERIKYSAIPVVMAPFGLTLGGGTEVVLHGAATHAHIELYMGLVETSVGVVPAGGGCKEMLGRVLSRWPEGTDPMPAIQSLFETLALAKVSGSAEEARSLGFLEERDMVGLRRDSLLSQAKQIALGLAHAGYRPPRPRLLRLPGPSGYATLRSRLLNYLAAHQITPHDVVVSSELARVVTGGQTSPSLLRTEQDILDLEREAFLKLCGEEKTRERMTYLLQNNKPLRN